MKNCLIFALVAVMVSTNVFAQPRHGQPCKEDRMARMEEMLERSALNMAEELGLDDELSAKFVPMYVDYRKDGMKMFKGANHPGKPGREFTEEEADARIRADFEISRKMVDIREEYYVKFKQFMTSGQLLKLYDLERKEAGRMQHEQHMRHQEGAGARRP